MIRIFEALLSSQNESYWASKYFQQIKCVCFVCLLDDDRNAVGFARQEEKPIREISLIIVILRHSSFRADKKFREVLLRLGRRGIQNSLE